MFSKNVKTRGCVWLHTSESFHCSVSAAFIKQTIRELFSIHTWLEYVICELLHAGHVICGYQNGKLLNCVTKLRGKTDELTSVPIPFYGVLVEQGAARTLQMSPGYQHWAVCWICISWHYFVGPACWRHTQTGHCTSIKHTFHVINTYEFSPYRTVNTLRLYYKNQSVNVV